MYSDNPLKFSHIWLVCLCIVNIFSDNWKASSGILINTKNKVGPKTRPCGTPVMICCWRLTFIVWIYFWFYPLSIILFIFGIMPEELNLVMWPGIINDVSAWVCVCARVCMYVRVIFAHQQKRSRLSSLGCVVDKNKISQQPRVISMQPRCAFTI